MLYLSICRTHKELGDHMKFAHFEETKDFFCTQPNVSSKEFLGFQDFTKIFFSVNFGQDKEPE